MPCDSYSAAKRAKIPTGWYMFSKFPGQRNCAIEPGYIRSKLATETKVMIMMLLIVVMMMMIVLMGMFAVDDDNADQSLLLFLTREIRMMRIMMRVMMMVRLIMLMMITMMIVFIGTATSR